MYRSILFIVIILIFGCISEDQSVEMDSAADVSESTLYNLLEAKSTGIDFVNTINETPTRNQGTYEYMYNGSGVAIGDINNDDLPDLFFAGNDASNKLYLNQGNLKFKDISASSGIVSEKWSTGVSMVDVNSDGLLDIYVCNSGPENKEELLSNELYINNGDLTFTESADLFGIADDSYSSQAVFFDMDQDGDLDLFVMNHGLMKKNTTLSDWDEGMEKLSSLEYRRSCSTLYLNDGKNKYTDVTKNAGLYKIGFGLGVGVYDFDDNGFLDIYVANDYFVPDFMYLNSGKGYFEEKIQYKMSHCSYYSMGCDIADINNDGLADLSVVDMTPSDHYRSKVLMESMDVLHFSALVDVKNYIPQYMFNSLQLNRGNGAFSEISNLSGVAKTDWSWAVLLYDIDNSGLKDMIVTNGYRRDTKDQDWSKTLFDRYADEGQSAEVFYNHLQQAPSNPTSNYLFRNNGKLDFEDFSEEWGFDQPSFSNGAAYGDLDNDGDLDVVINNLDQPASIYQNTSRDNHDNNYIQFELSDAGSSASVLHSSIYLYTGGHMQKVNFNFVRGYLSSMQPIAHFGLGDIDQVDSIKIKWSDGNVSVVEDLDVNQKHHIDKANKNTERYKRPARNPFFKDIASKKGESFFVHEENTFDDFEKQILLPHRQSTLGPCVSVGDLNNDGWDDFFIGGAKGQVGNVFLQHPTAGLIPAPQKAFKEDIQSEDVGSLLFDCDNDGDLDLYVASGGGGEYKPGDLELQDRLYINSGDKGFIKSSNSLPIVRASTSLVTANDWDKDGDLDLFIGGRTSPGYYPNPPASFLLQNDNGIFTDKTDLLAPQIRYLGMVTSAEWIDVNGDGREDLIVVGEWMPITIFLNTAEGFVNATERFGFSGTVGWWYSINKGDFDNDGDLDLIVGNLGLNNKFHPSDEKPLHVYSYDFDNNKTNDIVLSMDYKGNLVPVRGKECSSQQMPFIEKKYPKYSEFASSTLTDIYGSDKIEKALHYKAVTFASMYIENKGNGKYDIKELPIEAQLGPINDIVVYDFNEDSKLDLVVGGAILNTEVETPAYDGSKGLLLFGNGDGTFKSYLNTSESGIYMPFNVKNLELMFVTNEKRPAIIVGNNNNRPHVFTWLR